MTLVSKSPAFLDRFYANAKNRFLSSVLLISGDINRADCHLIFSTSDNKTYFFIAPRSGFSSFNSGQTVGKCLFLKLATCRLKAIFLLSGDRYSIGRTF